MEAMKDLGTRHSPGEGRRGGVAGALVVAQVALSVVLVVAAGLFARTFAKLATLPLGFRPDPLLAVTIEMQRASIEPAERVPTLTRALEAVRHLPGVNGAALSLFTPLA